MRERGEDERRGSCPDVTHLAPTLTVLQNRARSSDMTTGDLPACPTYIGDPGHLYVPDRDTITRTFSNPEQGRERARNGPIKHKVSLGKQFSNFKPSDDVIMEEDGGGGAWYCSTHAISTPNIVREMGPDNLYTFSNVRKGSEPTRSCNSEHGVVGHMKRYSVQLNHTLENVAHRFLGERNSREYTYYRRTFDEWVEKNIQVRECYKFVKKTDDHSDNDPICHCKNKLSKHTNNSSGSDKGATQQLHFMEMPEESTWTQQDNTMLTKNNAFGKITFDDVEECAEEAQYMRIAKDYSTKPRIEILRSLFADFWKLETPDLLISVSGGAKSFNVPQDICDSFQQGLLNAARSTRAWIITGGQHCGVMKVVGGVIGQCISTSKIPTIGVGNWGKTWKNELLIQNRNGHYGGQREATCYPVDKEKPEKGYATLDPNHTHHFLVDDGTTGNDGIEDEFRAALESLICEIFMLENVPLPMVCIMVEGGMRGLQIAISTLKKGNTLVVLEGSGRASDILCYGFENSIEIDSEDTGGRKERKMPAECDVEIKRLIQKDFEKYDNEKEMLDLILEISTYRDYVTIYSIQNPEPLDFYILSSLMRSSANANALSATKMRQMKLAITWGHAKIAREFIFSQKLYKFSRCELEQLMEFAITKQRTQFVKLLMDYGCDLRQFLTAKNLKTLFNRLNPKSGGYRLLMEKAERKLRKMKFDPRNVEDGQVHKTPEIQLSDVGSLLGRIMQGSYTSIFSCQKKKYETGSVTFDNPFDLMTVYCALDNCQDMALLFWKKCRTPMATGIIAHRIYNYLDMMESKWARMDEEMTEQLEKAASDFESLSYGLMTMCYHNYEKKEWVNILEVKMVDWGNLSLFEVAQITSAKNFLSHAAYQSYLTDMWMGEVHPSTPFFLLALCAVLPPFPIFLKYNSKFDKKNADLNPRSDKTNTTTCKDVRVGRKPNPLRRLQLFYTSPAVKFILNGITYLVFLGLYICSILEANECGSTGSQKPRIHHMIGWKDYYLIIFVSSTIPIEISQVVYNKVAGEDGKSKRQVIDGNTKSVLKKFKIYFKQMYNVVDLLAILVFTFAFVLKCEVKCDDVERYNLTKFSNYHYYRLFSAFCFILYCVRFIQMFEMNDKIGPKIFMLKRMSVDLFFFLFLLGVFTFSYCVASEALLYPFHDRPVNRTIFAAFRRSYFNVFGDLDISGLSNKLVEGHCNEHSYYYMMYGNLMKDKNFSNYSELQVYLRSNNSAVEGYKKYKNESKIIFHDEYCEILPINVQATNPLDLVEDTPVGLTNYYITFCLLCMYVLIVNIMLINLLIAIFSNTYSESKARSGIIYKTQRASVIVEFEERPFLPNPLSMVYFSFIIPYTLMKRCCAHKNTETEDRCSADLKTSGRARRAQLIQAECMVLHLKKEGSKKDALVLLEAQNRKISTTVDKIADELKQITLKQHKETFLGLSTKRLGLSSFGNTVSQAMQAQHVNKTAVPHKYSLTPDSYSKYGYTRVHVPRDAIEWDTSLGFYDPPEFTDEATDTDEPFYPDDIRFNSDNGIVNRVSSEGPYRVDLGDPLNVRGRTGLRGRGVFRRWGPNQYSITVVTRWYRAGTGKQVHTKDRPVMEVLLLKDKTEEDELFRLPSIHTDKKDTGRLQNKMFLKKIYFNAAPDRKSGKERLNVFQKVKALASQDIPELEEAFSKQKPVYNGYFDHVHNTDNAWMEVDVTNVHLENPLADRPLQPGVCWQRLDSKVPIHNNEAWLLKKTCHINRSYNPYSGESLL